MNSFFVKFNHKNKSKQNYIYMNKTLIWISIVSLMLFACKARNAQPAAVENPTTTDLVVNPDALVQMDVTVEGMSCTGCETTINTGVGEIAGVVEVKSSYQDGKTIVKFDSTQTNIDKISQVISEKGYTVTGFVVHKDEDLAAPDEKDAAPEDSLVAPK
jgi:copper chaperone CopZ